MVRCATPLQRGRIEFFLLISDFTMTAAVWKLSIATVRNNTFRAQARQRRWHGTFLGSVRTLNLALTLTASVFDDCFNRMLTGAFGESAHGSRDRLGPAQQLVR